MKQAGFFLIIMIPLFFIGCVDKEGISLKYYPECHEYYDYYGVYHEKCDNNIYNFKTKKKRNAVPLCLDCN
jgi:IMP cyclohydrolase